MSDSEWAWKALRALLQRLMARAAIDLELRDPSIEAFIRNPSARDVELGGEGPPATKQ